MGAAGEGCVTCRQSNHLRGGEGVTGGRGEGGGGERPEGSGHVVGGLLEYSVGGLGFRILNGQTRRLVHPGGPLTHGLIQEAQIELGCICQDRLFCVNMCGSTTQF